MIKAIIIDDELSAVGVIESLLEKESERIEICAKCMSVETAVQAIRKHLPELIFLDVELIDGSGFEVVEQIEHLPGRIVFVTAFEHYAMRAIKNQAFDYILKPINPSEFAHMIDKVCLQINTNAPMLESGGLMRFMQEAMKNKIAIPTRHGFQYVEMREILYIKGEGSYSNLYMMEKKELMVSKIIKDFESILTEKGFLRVHKSYLVNMNHIAELRKDDSGYLVMDNGIKIPISHKDREKVLYKLRLFSNLI